MPGLKSANVTVCPRSKPMNFYPGLTVSVCFPLSRRQAKGFCGLSLPTTKRWQIWSPWTSPSTSPSRLGGTLLCTGGKAAPLSATLGHFLPAPGTLKGTGSQLKTCAGALLINFLVHVFFPGLARTKSVAEAIKAGFRVRKSLKLQVRAVSQCSVGSANESLSEVTFFWRPRALLQLRSSFLCLHSQAAAPSLFSSGF